MFGFGGQGNRESAAILSAIDRAQAVIKFDLDGTVTEVNDNFLKALGYERSEVIGRHHRMFVDPDYAASPEYEAFWNRLRGGAFEAGQFRRIGKSGKDVWIEASYNPVLGHDGRPFKVIKFATDITRQKEIAADQVGQLSAIRKSQAVIEFDLQGNILDANENFCQAVGYTIDEIRGRHHSIFVCPEERDNPEYGRFWARLRTGEFQSAQYLRLGKGGRQIWIQATYNPIFDAAGRPYKVVKFATDITAQVELLERLRSISNDNFSDISRAIDDSTARSTGAEKAADVTTDAVQHMAAAAEELASSVEAIAHSMAQSRAATDSAMERAEEAGTFTVRLNEAAEAMGGIVGLIQKIAGQINLLALNATIEAARAGEFGRGFAVVAQEVKNLANQAASATDQITAEIGGIQSISGNVVEALDAIRTAIEGMRIHVSSTASAAEEQSAVTREIAGNMDNAARSVADIAGNVRGISQSVHVVSEKVDGTREAARVLAR